jgi:hypothetical protein
MKTKFLPQVLFLLASGILLLIDSCTIYLPQPVNIPLMNEKNEVQLSGGATMLGGLDGSVAYAAANHVALQAYGSLHTEDIRYFQGSIGYYTKNKSDINLEIYAGLGSGNGNNWGFEDDKYVDGDYLLYFAQANIGQTNLGSAHIDYGFGLKTGLFDAEVSNDTYPNPVYYTNHSWLIEPQAFVRMGGEKFKVGFQVNGARVFNLDNKASTLMYSPVNFGISINYRIAPSLRREK